VHQLYAQFLHLLNSVWHRRWAALGAAWLVALLGWALVVALPNTYTSSARIFIDATSIMKPVEASRSIIQLDLGMKRR
jgi:uncharacterized protein involved in exopolysaccharide biosynthesis